MVNITLFPNSSVVPVGGWVVRYRIKDSGGSYTFPPTFFTYPIEFTTLDPGGTLYEGFVKRDCGDLESTEMAWSTPCDCATGYSPAPNGLECQSTETVAPTVTSSGFCLAIAQNGAYSDYESRIYASGFSDATVALAAGSTGGFIQNRMTVAPQWANPAASISIGPMNRCAVWIDSDCNGVKNALADGVSTTIGYAYNNSGSIRTIYVGIGADNGFSLKVNGTVLATCGLVSTPSAGSDIPFKIWHIFPVVIQSGANYFNAVAVGDGTVSDSIGMTIYDNNALELAGATSDAQLNILFTTENLRGTDYDVATCPATYSLDTSGGQGNYICRKTVTKVCNSSDI